MALHWLVQVCLWFLSSTAISLSSSLSSSSSFIRSDCQRSCGNISIPYPFGIGDPNCYRNSWFNITCDETFTPPKAFMFAKLEVLNISLQGQLRTKIPIGWDCYSKSGNETSNEQGHYYYLEGSPYAFSNTRNKFTAIGCDTQALLTAYTNTSGSPFAFGCTSLSLDTAGVINGSCTGIGCCQSSIPAGITTLIELDISSLNNHTDVLDFNPCGYAFLVDQDYFNFSVVDLLGTNFRERNEQVPVVLDWVAGNETCQAAIRNKTDYACRSEDSYCYNSTNAPGYQCSCSPGYQGNPYVQGGCEDIDECKEETSHNCTQTCINIPGSYQCKCPKGYKGDGWNNGSGCIAEGFPVRDVTLGLGISLLFSLIASTWTYWLWRKRKSMKLKEKFFHQNGGLLLQQKICSRRGDLFKIFTIEELERATNNYNASTVVGQGGFGIVYKGVLPNSRIVAIKKSKLVDASQIEQFINELDILSQVNHRNVVKLLGCCLEDEVPILVYEFISNGTLYHHIHEVRHLPSISLENRLRIATEIAEALAYLHSAASMPILHRDVKSANILLDNNFMAKVSDFGASRLVANDHTQIITLVQGTWGYLDPECFQTGKLTDKSDVYSFAVVLVELLTGKKPICLNRTENERSLAMCFVHALEEDRLFQILEERVRSEGSKELLMAIAQLVKKCLRFKGEDRPTMREVVVGLQALRGFQDHPWIENEKNERFLHETLKGSSSDAYGHHSMENHFNISFTSSG